MTSVKMRCEVKELAVQELQILFRQFVKRPTDGLLWLLLLRCEAFRDEFGESVSLALLQEERDA